MSGEMFTYMWLIPIPFLWFISVFVCSCFPNWKFWGLDLKEDTNENIFQCLAMLILSIFWIFIVPLLILAGLVYWIILIGNNISENTEKYKDRFKDRFKDKIKKLLNKD